MMLAALANRRFASYLIAAGCADAGYWMALIAQGWLVLTLTNSPLWLGVIAASAQVPYLLFSLAGGDLADRFDRRIAVAVGNGIIAALALAIAVLIALHAITIAWLAVLVFCIGSIIALEHPVDRAWLYDLVEGERLGTAIALSSLEWSLARTVGPAIGGAAVALIGVPFGYAAFGVLSIPLVILALVLRSRGVSAPDDDDAHATGGDERNLIPFCVMIATFTMGVTPYITLLPDIARHTYGLGARGYGFFAAAGGMGAIVAGSRSATSPSGR